MIQNGRVIDPTNKREPEFRADILVKNGQIAKIGRGLKSSAGIKVIPAKGKLVTAGLVDLHVHLREPGREDKETLATATRAAAAGGVTTLLGMPNTSPTIDNQTVVKFVLARARETGLVKVLTSGALTKNSAGQELAEIWELREAGARVVLDDAPQTFSMELKRLALEYCQTYGLPIFAHAEDATLAQGAALAEGFISTQLGLPGSPGATEALAVARTIELLREVPVPYHFTHLSTKRAVELIRRARAEGLPITADTTPHHLTLTSEACLNYNTQAKVAPPLRGEADRQALLAGLLDGTLDAVGSDHAPHLLVDKFLPFTEAAFGITGLETLFALTFTELVKSDKMSLPNLIAKLTVNPARILRSKAGLLKVGGAADLAVFDIRKEYKIDCQKFHSKGRNTPFHGRKVFGRATEVLVDGSLVVEQGKVLEVSN